MWLIYKTDDWHSYASRQIVGIATTHRQMTRLVRAQAKKEGHKLSEDTMEFLLNKHQTQDYEGPGEFVVELVGKNMLL